MAKTKRVHNIAKELGVDSKAIVAKCEAEGVPGITNHMSVVKVGLEMTIKEWFSESATQDTAIETSDRVDLKKARKPRKRKSASDSDGEGSDATTAVAEPGDEEESAATTRRMRALEDIEADAAAMKSKARKTTKARPSADQPEEQAPESVPATESDQPDPQPTAEESAPAAETPAQTAGEAAASDQPAEPPAPKPVQIIRPVGVINVPQRPTIVKPAGEQLHKPTSAKLRGPDVIRVEKADPLPPPRSKRQFSSGPPIPTAAPGAGGRTTGGRGPKGKGEGEGGDERSGRPRNRRSMNTRRGRSAEAQLTGPTNLSEQDLLELDARLKGAPGFVKKHRRDLKKREIGGGSAQSPAQVGGKVEISEPIFIKNLSAATGIKSAEIISYLFKQKGIMANINAAIGAEMAMEVCLEYDIELEVKEQQTAEESVMQEFEMRDPVDVRSRPPVVTVLGHVDHGKTSLLDRIRKADVASHEAGGITQHVGAYRVTIKGSDAQDKTVVFLDTPGHEAFTNMRARGASMTDIVVLVVAADDGVMPQTVESINHAKAAEVPIVVALNKIDVPQATPDKIQKIYGQLAEHGLNPTEWGGNTEVVKVSAVQGLGVTDLLEVLDYQAELLELKADYGGPARGAVIEAEMQEGRGPVARVLIQEGLIKVGDFIVSGRAFGRVRDMTNDRDESVREAGPATPLEISGIDRVPDAGDKFYVTGTLKKAEEIAMHYREVERMKDLASQTKVTLANFSETIKAGEVNYLRVVLKADVQGSVETIKASLEDIGNNEVAVKVLHSAVGGITESDVLLADASDAIVIGFNIVAPPVVRDVAENHHVDVQLYRVIYDLIDDVKKALEGMLTPDVKEEELGTAEVKEVFNISKLGTIAGCMISEGSALKSAKVRIIRDGVVVTNDRDVESLRRIKDEVREVRAGTECGVRIKGYNDIKPGDKIVFYKRVEVARKLESARKES